MTTRRTLRALKWDEVNKRHYFVPKTVPKKEMNRPNRVPRRIMKWDDPVLSDPNHYFLSNRELKQMTSQNMRYVIQLNTKPELSWYASKKYQKDNDQYNTYSNTQAKTYTKQWKAWRAIEQLNQDGRLEFAGATVKSVTITRTVQVNDV